MKKVWTEERIADVEKMMREGKTQTEIAKKYGVTRQMVSSALIRHRTRRQRSIIMRKCPYQKMAESLFEMMANYTEIAHDLELEYNRAQRIVNGLVEPRLSEAVKLADYCGLTIEEAFSCGEK